VRCMIVYDIQDDGKRTRIADICLDYGLDRIQYSVFAGALTQSQQDELMLKLTRTLGKRPGKLLLLPICATDWANRREHIVVPKVEGVAEDAGRIAEKPDDADDQGI
jgi:CRISPR-associated protein Cas2